MSRQLFSYSLETKVAKCGETFEKVMDNPRGKTFERLSGFYVHVSVLQLRIQDTHPVMDFQNYAVVCLISVLCLSRYSRSDEKIYVDGVGKGKRIITYNW